MRQLLAVRRMDVVVVWDQVVGFLPFNVSARSTSVISPSFAKRGDINEVLLHTV